MYGNLENSKQRHTVVGLGFIEKDNRIEDHIERDRI